MVCSWANRAGSNPGSFEMSVIPVIFGITPSLKGGEAQAYGGACKDAPFPCGNIHLTAQAGEGVNTQEQRSRALVNAHGRYASIGRECCNFQLKWLRSHVLPSPCVWFAALCQPSSLSPAPCWPQGWLELPELRVLSLSCWETHLGNCNKWEQEGPNLTSFEPCHGGSPLRRWESWASLETGNHDHFTLCWFFGVGALCFLMSAAQLGKKSFSPNWIQHLTQAVMGGFTALCPFPSPPPSALWSCKDQSS